MTDGGRSLTLVPDQSDETVDAGLRVQVAWAGRILAMGGHGDYTLGHVSARSVDGRHVLMKPNGLGLEEVAPTDVLALDMSGTRLSGAGPVHLESVLHTEIYRARPDVGAVVHTHPPYATALGATDAKLELLNHDAVLFRDGLAYFDETAELIVLPEQGAAVARALGDHRALVMRGHGVIVTGESVPWATYAALTLERVLRIQSIARSLGNLRPMTPEMAARVYPDKYRNEHVANYWDYLVRQVRRAGLAAGMPETGVAVLERFSIHQPISVAEASEMLAHFGPDAAVYAGGTELLIVMKERLAHFPHLIDIKRIPGLRDIAYDAERQELAIGAVARHRDLERSPLVRGRFPALAVLEAAVANVRVRTAGTLGGNLCFAEPHSDPATLLTALDARLALVSAAGTREIPMASFITGLMETARGHDEILTAITVPEPGPNTGIAYERFKLHERPTAAVAAVITVADGAIAEARVVAGSVGERPQRLTETERFLRGQRVSEFLTIAAADCIRDEVETVADAFESDAYKRQLVRAVGRRAIAAALRLADREGERHAA